MQFTERPKHIIFEILDLLMCNGLQKKYLTGPKYMTYHISAQIMKGKLVLVIIMDEPV